MFYYRYILTAILGLVNISFAGYMYAQSPLSYVNTLTGTANSATKTALKHGKGTEQLANTIPAVTLPFAMTQWTPQTRCTETKCLSPYYYKDSLFSGFRGSHWLNGGCAQDYGSVTIMPLMGKLVTSAERYATVFRHTDEVASPAYYGVTLPGNGIKAEVTATKRCAIMQFTALRDDSIYILITPNSDENMSSVRVDNAQREIAGYNPVYRIYQKSGEPANFNGYFVVQIESSFSRSGTYSGDQVYPIAQISNMRDAGAFIGMKIKKGMVIRIKAGTSFSSIEGARKNLAAEIKGWDFDEVRKAAEHEWQLSLRQITINAGQKAEREMRIFYTSLYHIMQLPRLFNDVDGSYPRFAGNYENDKITGRNYYDDFSMWDIYRAQLPLLEILNPGLTSDLVNSLIIKGRQGNWLPNFPIYNNYTSAMIGDHSTAFIASAFTKGIGNYDINEAYRLMRKNAYEIPTPADYLDGRGRRALASYLKYGYYPLEDSINDAFHKKEQVSRTLEYAYDDYCLAKVAKMLNKRSDYHDLMRRAQNYRNVFDPVKGFVNGRYRNGSWYENLHPDIKHSFITEGTSRQYSFYVPQNIYGLAEMMGGPEKLSAALDSLFAKGEYWHGNEPGHQIPFMYNYVGEAYKTQKHVAEILDQEYSDGPGGLCGNEDAGQISAWYIFASTGLYPVDPVSSQYIITSPLLSDVTIHLPSGKEFRIKSLKQSDSSVYIQSVKLNNKAYTKSFLTHADLTQGGIMEFIIGDKPNFNWGIAKKELPRDISKAN